MHCIEPADAPMPTVRPCRPQDAFAMWRACRRLVLPLSPYSFVTLTEAFASTCVVAEVDGDVVGFLFGHVSAEAPDVLRLWWLHAEPDYVEDGTVDALLEALCALPACRDVQQVVTVSGWRGASDAEPPSSVRRGEVRRLGSARVTTSGVMPAIKA
jgi:L-2,4-diaminobutyric acid acetyltransferase